MGVIKYSYKDTVIGINIGRYTDRSQFFFLRQKLVFP